MKIDPSKFLRSFFFDLDFFIFHTIFNEKFSIWKNRKMKKMSFFEIFWDRKKSKIFIEKCMKNGKIEIEKNRSQNFWWTDFHFDIAFLLIHGFGRNFVQNYTYFHCGGDAAGENPPFEALRRALRIRMSSIPPDSYIIRFLSHSRLTRLLSADSMKWIAIL